MGEQQAKAGRSGSAAGLCATVLVHGAAIYVLLSHASVSPAVVPPQPLAVRFIAEAEEAPARPPAAPAKAPAKPPVRVERKAPPKPQPPKPQVVAAVSPEPSPRSVPSQSESPAPAPSEAPVQAPSSQPALPAAPDAVALASARSTAATPPSFNADYLRNPAPRYPPLARRMGEQGKVVLRVLVSAAGDAAKVEVRTSSGSDVLDDAALDAVKRWRFVPARQGEQPVDAWVLVPITFTLQG